MRCGPEVGCERWLVQLPGGGVESARRVERRAEISKPVEFKPGRRSATVCGEECEIRVEVGVVRCRRGQQGVREWRAKIGGDRCSRLEEKSDRGADVWSGAVRRTEISRKGRKKECVEWLQGRAGEEPSGQEVRSARTAEAIDELGAAGVLVGRG